MEDQPYKNTDKHLFRDGKEDNYYAPSCHVTKDKKLGINVGGCVKIKSLEHWHDLDDKIDKSKTWPRFNVFFENKNQKEYTCHITCYHNERFFGCGYTSKNSPNNALMEAYKEISRTIEKIDNPKSVLSKGEIHKSSWTKTMESIENREDKSFVSGLAHLPEEPFWLKDDYCDQCGNTGKSLFNGTKCDCGIILSTATPSRDIAAAAGVVDTRGAIGRNGIGSCPSGESGMSNKTVLDSELTERFTKKHNTYPSEGSFLADYVFNGDKWIPIYNTLTSIDHQIKELQQRITDSWTELNKIFREQDKKNENI